MPAVPSQVSKPRVLIAAAQFSRESGGVEQYAENLVSAHKARGYDIWELAGKADQKSFRRAVISDFWKVQNVSTAFRKISEIQPRIFNLQYVPQSFSKTGISPGLLSLLWKIRKELSAKILITFHEVYEPFLWNKPWRFFPAMMQRIQANLLLLLAHRALFVTPVFIERIKKSQPWFFHKTEFIPVPSNIRAYPLKETEKAQIRCRFTPDSNEVILGTLSKTLHQELRLPLLIDIAARLHAARRKCRVHLLGKMSGGFAGQREKIDAYARQKGISVFWSGELTEEELSHQLQLLDAYLVMHHDGVSPRNTAFMAAISHGLPVFAARSPQMKFFPEFETAVQQVYPRTVENAAEQLAAFFKDPEKSGRQESLKRVSFYEKYFSMQKYMEKIERIYSGILKAE